MHSDNCILDEAHGVCRKEALAYTTWRDYRCVLEGRQHNIRGREGGEERDR